MGILFVQKQRQVYLYLLLGVMNEVHGQYLNSHHFINPFALNVTGNSSQLNEFHIDWSIGEAFLTKTLSTQNGWILSTGFLQSIYAPLNLYDALDSFAIQIKVGPNPFSNKIIIQSKVDEVIINSIRIIDFEGNVIYNLNESFSGIHFYHEIKIGKLMHPICFLSIQYSIADKIYKSKYLKLIQH